MNKNFHLEWFGGGKRLTFMRLTAIVVALASFVIPFGTERAWAQLPGLDLPSINSSAAVHHTQAQLLFSADTAKAGETVLAGVRLTMDPGWHTYWKNPGDAGLATTIKWQLPAGVSAGEIQWPLPEKIPPAEVTTYGYVNEVMLLVPLKIESNVPPGALDIKAKVSWLECKETCIPAGADVQATLMIGSESKASTAAAAIQSWKAKTPRTDPIFSFQAWWGKTADDKTRSLVIQGQQMADDILPVEQAEFFPAASDDFDIQAATEKIPSASGFSLRKMVKKLSGDWPKEISGLVVVEGNGQRNGFEVKLSVADKAPAGMAGSAQTTATATDSLPSPPLWQMLFYAFIGGLILNLMPCVLPVIALKILGFVSEASSEPSRVRNLGFVYALGVLVSFLAFAGIVIGVKAAGHHAGWGMQFGSPIFVVCLTTLVTLVALNLFGVFEVTPGGGALDKAGELASRHGASGAFFNGLLATILATPCTAPFLAPALGFAFAQTAPVVILIFLTIGLGLAAPYVLLSCNPALLKFLPKPGAWMEKFKIAMGFPMLATVVWLFSVAAADYGSLVFWLGVFLVITAFAAWVYGEFFQRGRARRGVALATALLLLIGGYAYALEGHLHWRDMISEQDVSVKSSDKTAWQPWSPSAVAAARAQGKIVLVDFTASWCVTCNAIIKPALEGDAVSARLKELNAVRLLADYTRTPPALTEEIAKYGGAGVPLVLVYPKNSGTPPIVLPQPSPLQLPSSYGKIVLDALDQAAK